MAMGLLELPRIMAKGGPAALGHAQGEAFRTLIQAFVDQRLRAARVYLYGRGIRDERAFLDLGSACLDELSRWDGPAWQEHQAVADSAQVDAVALYTAANMTDIRDILAQPRPADGEGCSSALVSASHSSDGRVMAAQTWDLSPTDLDYVVAVQRCPDDGPRTWSVTCCGCPSLMAMNEHGLCIGTTNITTRDARVGIPYLSVLHRAIRCRDRQEAGTIFEQAPLAAAHGYWAADAEGVNDWECSPGRRLCRAGGPLQRTNHCLAAEHQAIEAEPATSSSRTRLARLEAWLRSGKQDVDSLRRLLADRSDGVDSINRLAEDRQGTITNACFIGVPALRELHACRGPADRGRWIRFRF